jgi:hypothetical protein
MKSITCLVVGLLAFCFLLPNARAQDINLTGYTQTFDDEFNSLSATTTSPKGSSTWYALPENSAGYYSESTWDINALSVSGGILSDKAFLDSSNNWHSGELLSVDPTTAGFTQTYGYFEIRCQMPNSGDGAWPAFWLDTTSGITGGQNEEIDIFEWYGICNTAGSYQDLVQETSHNWNPDGSQNTTTAPYLPSTSAAIPNGTYPWQGYHIYGCQIDPAHITWYIDGVQTNQCATPTSYMATPFFIELDYALGGGWPLSGMVNNSSFNVDWVRVYSLPTGGSAPSITSSTSATGTAGSAFTYQITASNSPTSYSATGLPAGLSVNTSTGAITGTPTSSGTSSVTIGASNTSGTGTATLTLTVAAGGSGPITWGSAQHMSGVSDVSTTGTLVDAATFNSTAQTVNGVTFNPMAASGTIAGSTGYTDASTKISANSPGGSPGAYGTAFSTASPSSAAYSAATATLAFGYYQNGTVILSGLTSGHTYQVEVWSDYTGSPGNCNTTFTGSNTVTLVPDAGEYAIGTFTATASSLTFNYNYGTNYGILSAIVLRDTTSGGSAPAITSSTSASGTVGSAFTYQITASNSPTSFSASGLPSGLSVSTSTGAITGTPTASGTSSVTIGATHSSGTGTATLTLTVSAAGSPPSITSSTSASGTVGVAFTYQITASNSPTSYSATGLPSGLSVNTSTGAITGTPTASGSSSVTIKATNAYGTGSATLTLTVSAASSAQITWGAAQHMSGTTDVSTTGTFVDAATFNSTAETVNGVTFNPMASSGTIAGSTGYTDASTKISANSPGGSPGAYGTAFTTASPSSAAYSAATATLAFGYYQNGTVILSGLTSGHTYQVQVWSDYTGSPGNCNTTFTGANTVTLVPDAGEFAIGTFTATASSLTFNYNYGANYGILSAISLRDTTPGSAPAITSSTSASGTVGTAFSYQITATNSPTSYSASGLPSGLSVNTSTGAITGTPSSSGTSSVTIGATNATGTGTATLTLTVSAAGTSQITWGAAQHMSGITDVSATGTLVDAATFYSTAQTVNGVTFNPLASSGTIGGYTGYTDSTGKISANSPGNSPGAYGTAFTTASPSSAAYSAATSVLAFGYYQNGTVVLSGLTSGHTYQVQVWSDYTGSPGNCNTTFTGANTVTLVPDAGEFATGTFTASATSLTFNYNYGANYGILSAISVRDVTP